MTVVLAIGILAFVGIASTVLLYDGLATGSASHRQGVAGKALGRARAEVVVGAIGLAIVLWTAFGMITHAH